MLYTVYRKFQKSGRTITVHTNCSIGFAQSWCRNPDSSSRTCTDSEGKRRTKRSGPWFDCYEAQ